MVIGITALSLMLRKTALVVALAMIPALAIYICRTFCYLMAFIEAFTRGHIDVRLCLYL